MDELKTVKREIADMKSEIDRIVDAIDLIEQNHIDNQNQIKELKRILEKFYEHNAKKNDSIK